MIVKLVQEPGRFVSVTTADGVEILGLREVSFHAAPDKISTVSVVLFSSAVAVEGELVVAMIHPKTGLAKTVKSIAFADGEVWES